MYIYICIRLQVSCICNLQVYYICVLILIQWLFASLTYLIYIYRFAVWDSKLTSPKLGSWLQLWPVLPPVTVNCFYFKTFLSLEILFWIQQPCCLMLFNWQHAIRILLRNELLIKERPRAQITHFRNGIFNVKRENNFVLSWLKQLFS